MPASSPEFKIPGWTPKSVVAVPSTLKSGMLPAAFDAARGITELGNGQRLSPVQIGTLSPFLAASFDLNPARVASDLAKVRVYTGGPASGMPGWAVTLGRDIYVDGAGEVKNMFDWGYRRWLTHELGHTMQWRRADNKVGSSNLSRMRRSMLNYVGGMAVDGERGPGAIPRGVALWLRENVDPRNKNKTHISLSNAVHDTHHLEREAERHAQAFERLTNTPGAESPAPATERSTAAVAPAT